MKRKILTMLLSAAVILAAGAIAACTTAENQPHEHRWNDGEVTVAATCAKAGVKTYTCLDCNETKTEKIEKSEHAHSEGWLKNDDEHWHAATCEHSTERVGVAAHEWDEGTVVSTATCLKTGRMRYTCVCGLTKTETIEKTAHTYTKAWSNDGNRHWRVCTTDGCTSIADDGAHSWNDGEITTPATCMEEGEKTYTCTDCKLTKTETVEILTQHTYSAEWSSDENGHYRECTVEGCTARDGESRHSYGEWTRVGQVVKICKDCEYECAAPFLASGGNSERATTTVGGGETGAMSLFSRGLGNYYTISYSGSAPVKVTCEYYDRTGTFYNPEYVLSPTNTSFTVKLPDRAVAYLFIESDAETAFECELNLQVNDTEVGHTHSFDTEWSSDAAYHWHACTGQGCEEDQDAALHEYEGFICAVCGHDKRSDEQN